MDTSDEGWGTEWLGVSALFVAGQLLAEPAYCHALFPAPSLTRFLECHVLLDVTKDTSRLELAAELAKSSLQVIFDPDFDVLWHRAANSRSPADSCEAPRFLAGGKAEM